MTVTTAELICGSKNAPISEVPCATPNTDPCVFDTSPAGAIAGEPEVQIDASVIFCVVLSVRVAINCRCAIAPTGIDAVFGKTATLVTPSTVTSAVPFTPPRLAVIVAVPGTTPPTVPVSSTAATPSADELQVAT